MLPSGGRKRNFSSSSAKRDTFTINFVCDPNSHPGALKLVREEMSTLSTHVVHDVLFEFSTALACIPSPVDCQITGMLLDSGSSVLEWQPQQLFNPLFFLKILMGMSTT